MSFVEDFGRYGIPAIFAASFAAWCQPWSGAKACSPGNRLGNAAIGWGLGYALYRGLTALAEATGVKETMPLTGYVPALAAPRATGFDRMMGQAVDAEVVAAAGLEKV